jgi:hypothetical protein
MVVKLKGVLLVRPGYCTVHEVWHEKMLTTYIEHTMVALDYRKVRDCCQLLFSLHKIALSIYYMWKMQKNSHYTYSSHNVRCIWQKGCLWFGLIGHHSETCPSYWHNTCETLQFLPLTDSQQYTADTMVGSFSSVQSMTGNNRSYTPTGSSRRWPKFSYVYIQHTRTCSWIVGASAKVKLEFTVTWLSYSHWSEPQCHIVRNTIIVIQ